MVQNEKAAHRKGRNARQVRSNGDILSRHERLKARQQAGLDELLSPIDRYYKQEELKKKEEEEKKLEE